VVACERKHDTNNALISPEALVALDLLTLTSFSLFLVAAPPVVFEEFDIAAPECEISWRVATAGPAAPTLGASNRSRGVLGSPAKVHLRLCLPRIGL
jgi:hypothetical protein